MQPLVGNPTYSPPKQSPFGIPEIRENIENFIKKDEKTNVAYQRAGAIPTTEDGETFDSLPHAFFLAQGSKLFKEREQELKNQLRDLEIQEEQQEDVQEKAITRKNQESYKQEIAKIEEERQARYKTILKNAPELRAFMLEQPSLFNTQNAEKFAHRYKQVSPFLRTLEEYSKALQGFKKFLECDAYTLDSKPTLKEAKQIQEKLLEKWFKSLSISTKISATNARKRGFSEVQSSFLADPQKSEKDPELNERLGKYLRNLAENPLEEAGPTLENLALELGPQTNQRIHVNYIVHGTLIKYLRIIPQSTIKPVLEKLTADSWRLLPKLLKSIFFEKLKLCLESEIYELIEKIAPRLSYSDKELLLEHYPKLPRNAILKIIKNDLKRQSIGVLNHFYNYIEKLSENELRLNLKNIMNLIQSVYDISYIEDIENVIYINNQHRIIGLLKNDIKKLPNEAAHSLLLGMVDVFNLFDNGLKYKLIQVMHEYLKILPDKEEFFAYIINNLNKFDKTHDRSSIINMIARYLGSKGREQASLSTLKLLTEKWGDLSSKDQETVISWLSTYLSQNRSQKLLDSMQKNLKKLKQKSQEKISELLTQYNSKRTLDKSLIKLKTS